MRPILKYFPLVMAALVLVFAPGVQAMENEDCLGCHGDAEMVGKDLFIHSEFDTTAHADIGCVSCHSTIGASHPDDGLPSGRTDCGDCHDQIAALYQESNHAFYADCGDCHNPHAVRSSTQVSGAAMNRMCTGCHDTKEMTALHDAWLPQAELHVTALPCITCHTGSENYVITLHIIERNDPRYGGFNRHGDFELAEYSSLAALAGDEDIRNLIDTDGDGLISIGELNAFKKDRRYGSLRLQGMMTPEQVSHDLSILDNRWDCSFCHASGPTAMQTSFLALPQPDGTFTRLPVQTGAVLDALYGTPDFYMMGATRSRTLDIVGLAIVAGGLVMPIGHGSLRLLTRKNRRKGGLKP
jgi:predicted CXXCH cytochrome family protein